MTSASLDIMCVYWWSGNAKDSLGYQSWHATNAICEYEST